jgi:hypothetical protein
MDWNQPLKLNEDDENDDEEVKDIDIKFLVYDVHVKV